MEAFSPWGVTLESSGPSPIPHPTQICVPDEHATTGASGCHAPPPRFFFVCKSQARFRLASPVVTCEGSIDCI
ncbi:uncharacterized protein CCOS01_13861 [Colletotrichum costaricense]|uniref:Uncharacterized protein n=1 Tax=Colletotrichum costaricense TaxID=1209916 RepID=A0AAJ0DVF0_9PEZI|nr:uncharacterized protein CCOS01_13861 [Colletotrichum costaricense]KAK1514580.1 hypothetical protein CCOS01_13861 [Colletotrichum costaricense]